MNVWLITVGEPLPVLSDGSRLWRTGMLANELAGRGHAVTWWTSIVDHIRKRRFPVSSHCFEVETRLVLRFLEGPLYRRNVSLMRLLNHRRIGKAFRADVAGRTPPDVILCSYPTIELAEEAVTFGKRLRIPVVLDVRDLWPDIFLQAVPSGVRPPSRLLLHPYFSAARRALGGAAALVAVSSSYLRWALDRAGRGAGPLDRVFPLAYSLPERPPSLYLEGVKLLERHGIGSESTVCIFAGTLGRTYDLAPVLEAARILAERGETTLHFLICGEGERASEWRAQASNLPNVSFTGWLEQTDMHAALAASHIGLAAYAKEAPQELPNKVIEYLAAGLPVVSSLSGETEQILKEGECGTTYEAGSARSLLRVLGHLANAERRAKLSYNARSKFEASFQAEKVYTEFADYIERVSAQKGDAVSRAAS